MQSHTHYDPNINITIEMQYNQLQINNMQFGQPQQQPPQQETNSTEPPPIPKNNLNFSEMMDNVPLPHSLDLDDLLHERKLLIVSHDQLRAQVNAQVIARQMDHQVFSNTLQSLQAQVAHLQAENEKKSAVIAELNSQVQTLSQNLNASTNENSIAHDLLSQNFSASASLANATRSYTQQLEEQIKHLKSEYNSLAQRHNLVTHAPHDPNPTSVRLHNFSFLSRSTSDPVLQTSTPTTPGNFLQPK